MQIDIDEDCLRGSEDVEFRGYWADAFHVGRCSVCVDSGRILKLEYNHQITRLCFSCATALRELLIDAIEDEK